MRYSHPEIGKKWEQDVPSIRRLSRRRRIEVPLCALGLLCWAAASSAQPSAELVSIGESVELESSELGEVRQLLVSLPGSYFASTSRYAVLYLTDGAENFPHASTLVHFLADNGFIPETIVVAIANTDRNRDFLTPVTAVENTEIAPTAGGADEFSRFLSAELVGFIDANYRTNDYRVLFGHSFGGFFTIYSMLKHADVFDSYIAASPSVFWNDEQLLELAKLDTNTGDRPGQALYVTLADTESSEAADQLAHLLSVLEEPRTAFKRLDGEIHTSTPHRTLYDGLQFVFDGWYLKDPLALFDDVGIAGIHEHFQAVDERYDYERGTPRSVIDQLGMALFESDRLEDLGDLITYDLRNYPTAPNNINTLAATYRDRGLTEKAIEFYSLSLSLSPSNSAARQALTELEVDVEQTLDRLAPSEELTRSLAGQYRTPNGNVLDIRMVDRGLALFANGPNELLVLSPTEYTLGPGILYFEFEVSDDLDEVALRVRTATTQWEQTEKLN